MASIEQLYKDFAVLADAKEKAGEHDKEYLSILSGVKGGSNEKRLASQFIARFFKFFPSMAEQAIDAQLDLCEDDDIAIRKQAIKDLPAVCKDNKENVPRIADVLTQLLQSEDSQELSLVQSSLMVLLNIDVKGTLTGLFSQITGGDEVVREKAIKFMSTRMLKTSNQFFTKEIEEFFMLQSKKVLEDVTGDEFVSIMKILSTLTITTTVQGRQQMVEIVAEQAALDEPFKPEDSDCVDRLMACIRQAMPFFSKNVHSIPFMNYMCVQVLPSIGSVENQEEGIDLKLEILKLFAEMATNAGDLENHDDKVENVYNKLVEYMPLPPEEENTPLPEAPNLQFSYVECLMYAFHQLAHKTPTFLAGEDSAERLRDFKIRLQYFARGLQLYIKQLRMALQGKTGEALKTDENKIKVVALKITSNINSLIKDLFHNPPAYKCVLHLSWKPMKPAVPATSPSAGQKRPGATPIKFDSGPTDKKLQKGDRKMYSPPSGKFSEKAGTFREQGNYRGNWSGGYRGNRGRGRGGWRQY